MRLPKPHRLSCTIASHRSDRGVSSSWGDFCVRCRGYGRWEEVWTGSMGWDGDGGDGVGMGFEGGGVRRGGVGHRGGVGDLQWGFVV